MVKVECPKCKEVFEFEITYNIGNSESNKKKKIVYVKFPKEKIKTIVAAKMPFVSISKERTQFPIKSVKIDDKTIIRMSRDNFKGNLK